MDFVNDNIGTLYRKLLVPSITGAVIMSIYSFVDTIAVGQSEGVPGTAAMAVIQPVYGIMIFLGILCGIGGSVMMSVARGQGNKEKGDACFTAAIVLVSVLSIIIWISLLLFRDPVLHLFGANEDVMPKAIEYGRLIIWFMPAFVYMAFIGSFIRNDGAPKLVMASVIIGGCVNMFGDWFFVFPLGMGMTGAALATVIGTLIQCIIMTGYFFQKRCQLRIIRPHNYLRGFLKILSIGFGAGVLDLGTVVITTVMNNQILRYAGTTELSLYGVMATIMGLFQAMFGGVGQAIQPLVSTNYGAEKEDRIKTVWKKSLLTVIVMGLIFTAVCELLPVHITKLFMDATPEAVQAAPKAFRLFSMVFIFLGATVLEAYYLQSVIREKASMVIGLTHGVFLSCISCAVMPLLFGISGLWLALPVTEIIISITGFVFITSVVNKQLFVEK